MRRAWLREIEGSDDEGNAECAGEFECTLGERGEENAELLEFDEAVAWAREHADRAYADIEGQRYVVVGHDPEFPPVPPELVERLRRGPRRPVRDAWRDRSDDAQAMRWEIVVDLAPPDLRPESRAGQERVVEAVAARLTAEGCDAVERTPGEIDAAIADIDAQWKRAGQPEEFGWAIAYRLVFVVTAATEAPTYRPVLERVRMAVVDELEAAAGRPPYTRGAEDIEGRWGAEVDVFPPGYEYQPPLL